MPNSVDWNNQTRQVRIPAFPRTRLADDPLRHRLYTPGETSFLAGAPPNPHVPPKAKFGGHGVEGFALDWNPIQVRPRDSGRNADTRDAFRVAIHLLPLEEFVSFQTGRLLSGDVEGGAFLWEPREGGWSQRPLFGGSSAKKKQKKKTNRVSLEELQWRPGQNDSGDVFAAAFSDGCVK